MGNASMNIKYKNEKRKKIKNKKIVEKEEGFNLLVVSSVSNFKYIVTMVKKKQHTQPFHSCKHKKKKYEKLQLTISLTS